MSVAIAQFSDCFMEEAAARLDELKWSIARMGREDYGDQQVAALFRALHSLKGSSAVFGLQDVAQLAHEMEDLLAKVRQGRKSLDTSLAATLLNTCEVIGNVLASSRPRGASASSFRSEGGACVPGKEVVVLEFGPLNGAISAADAHVLIRELNNLGTIEVLSSRNLDYLRIGFTTSIPTDDLIGVLTFIGQEKLARIEFNPSPHKRVVHRSQFSDYAYDVNLPNGMNETRTKAEGLFSPFRYVVRELACHLKKEVAFLIDCGDVELNPRFAGTLINCLMHLVRNSLVHGIEGPEEREVRGKSRCGYVRLSAQRADGALLISVEDDGVGFDKDGILAEARSRGMAVDSLASDKELWDITLEPGFSTAKEITAIAGRGVGLDVVRTSVESIGGTLKIESKQGAGASLRLRIPGELC